MSVLEELNPIKEKLKDLSLGEIMRGTRDLLGLKQWKLASLLGLNVAQMKILESNTYRDDPRREVIEKFCELFEYDEKVVWNQATSHVFRHKESMQIFGKHPHYAKRLEKMEPAAPKAHHIHRINLKAEPGNKCSLSLTGTR